MSLFPLWKYRAEEERMTLEEFLDSHHSARLLANDLTTTYEDLVREWEAAGYDRLELEDAAEIIDHVHNMEGKKQWRIQGPLAQSQQTPSPKPSPWRPLRWLTLRLSSLL